MQNKIFPLRHLIYGDTSSYCVLELLCEIRNVTATLLNARRLISLARKLTNLDVHICKWLPTKPRT